jgi:hypothetical protein
MQQIEDVSFEGNGCCLRTILNFGERCDLMAEE